MNTFRNTIVIWTVMHDHRSFCLVAQLTSTWGQSLYFMCNFKTWSRSLYPSYDRDNKVQMKFKAVVVLHRQSLSNVGLPEQYQVAMTTGRVLISHTGLFPYFTHIYKKFRENFWFVMSLINLSQSKRKERIISVYLLSTIWNTLCQSTKLNVSILDPCETRTAGGPTTFWGGCCDFAPAYCVMLYIRYGKMYLHKQRIFSRNSISLKNLLSIS